MLVVDLEESVASLDFILLFKCYYDFFSKGNDVMFNEQGTRIINTLNIYQYQTNSDGKIYVQRIATRCKIIVFFITLQS